MMRMFSSQNTVFITCGENSWFVRNFSMLITVTSQHVKELPAKLLTQINSFRILVIGLNEVHLVTSWLHFEKRKSFETSILEVVFALLRKLNTLFWPDPTSFYGVKLSDCQKNFTSPIYSKISKDLLPWTKNYEKVFRLKDRQGIVPK